ncbi:MAG: hypothetical protein ACKVX7_12725 [Planctomycetota bacterium]
MKHQPIALRARRLRMLTVQVGLAVVWVILGPGCDGRGTGPAPPVVAPVVAPAAPQQTAFATLEAEVAANVVGQAVGRRTLADFNLPAEFVSRVANRILAESFQDRTYGVYNEHPEPIELRQPKVGLAVDPWPAVVGDVFAPHRAGHAPVLLGRANLRPPLRNFRVSADRLLTFGLEAELNPNDSLQSVSDLVANRLAREGLLATTARAMLMLGVERFTTPTPTEFEQLERVGLPIDWLAYFKFDGAQTGDGQDGGAAASTAATIAALAQRLLEQPDPRELPDAALRQLCASARFVFRQCGDGFRVAIESGSEAIEMVRVQLTRGDSWGGAGDGGSLDIAKQLLQHLPAQDFLLAIEEQHSASLQSELAAASPPTPARARIKVLLQASAVAQWAQDNGKAGTVPDLSDASIAARRKATLLPRFVSRREDGSEFLPSEQLVAASLANVLEVRYSPLLFQGGDLLAVRDPRTGRRILFVGEAEIHRNTALGLAEREVRDAFQIEFGVDRVEVLPSISFHIDYDLTIREHDGELIAFVNDPLTAARTVLTLAVEALELHEFLPPEASSYARQALASSDDSLLLTVLANTIGQYSYAEGFALELAKCFADSVDHGVGNFQCVLVAMDILAASTIGDVNLTGPSHEHAYYRALLRQAELRSRLVYQLQSLGLRVAFVPSISAGSRSLNYVNGVSAPGKYLLPIVGSFFARLNDDARAVFARELGSGVEVIPIRTAESQRRLGALHCSVVVYGRAP